MVRRLYWSSMIRYCKNAGNGENSEFVGTLENGVSGEYVETQGATQPLETLQYVDAMMSCYGLQRIYAKRLVTLFSSSPMSGQIFYVWG